MLPQERIFYRDRLREARYAALADAEGFGAICFALEALGLRLLKKQAALGSYREKILEQALHSLVLVDAVFPSRFKSFEALYTIVNNAHAMTRCTRVPTHGMLPKQPLSCASDLRRP